MNVHHRVRTAVAVGLALWIAACSPALNWREVRLEQLSTLLPCKPDHAERMVQLASRDVHLKVSGCEAGGALYAISHVRVADGSQLEPVRTAWRQATLATLQVAAVPLESAPPDAQPEKLEGKRPDGSPLQAQLVWRTKGQDIYLVAVFGPKLNPEMTELLFSELRLQ